MTKSQRRKARKIYKVKYNCSIELDHKAPINELIEINTMTFYNRERAIEFLLECTSPITKLSELKYSNSANKYGEGKVYKEIGKKRIAL